MYQTRTSIRLEGSLVGWFEVKGILTSDDTFDYCFTPLYLVRCETPKREREAMFAHSQFVSDYMSDLSGCIQKMAVESTRNNISEKEIFFYDLPGFPCLDFTHVFVMGGLGYFFLARHGNGTAEWGGAPLNTPPVPPPAPPAPKPPLAA